MGARGEGASAYGASSSSTRNSITITIRRHCPGDPVSLQRRGLGPRRAEVVAQVRAKPRPRATLARAHVDVHRTFIPEPRVPRVIVDQGHRQSVPPVAHSVESLLVVFQVGHRASMARARDTAVSAIRPRKKVGSPTRGYLDPKIGHTRRVTTCAIHDRHMPEPTISDEKSLSCGLERQPRHGAEPLPRGCHARRKQR